MKSFSYSSRAAGFTLIEIMMVIGIMAIIAAVALPAYNGSVQTSRRANCVAVLEEARQGVERYFAKNFTYVGVSGGVPGAAGTDFPSKAPKTGADVFCNITASDLTATTYTLTATPVGSQSSDVCGTLSITHTGTLNATGGAVDDCF